MIMPVVLIGLVTVLYTSAFASTAREIPVADEVDVVIAGGSCGAVATALEVAKAGARVFVAAPRNYLGDDIAGTMRLWLEPGETPEECAIREIQEESGLLVENPVFKGLLTFPGFANEEDWYAFVFVASQFTGDLIDSPEGDLEWIDDAHLLELNLWDGDRIFLKWLDQPGFFSGKFIYKNGQYVDHEVLFYHR